TRRPCSAPAGMDEEEVGSSSCMRSFRAAAGMPAACTHDAKPFARRKTLFGESAIAFGHSQSKIQYLPLVNLFKFSQPCLTSKAK
ncbi:MAG: hypothetical protein ACI4QS_03290, partial [Comamonas sp.]